MNKSTKKPLKNILAIAGSAGLDYERIKHLFKSAPYKVDIFIVDKQKKLASFTDLWNKIRSKKYDMIFLEGSGLTGSLAAILAENFYKIPFIISTGDPISSFFSITISNFWGILMTCYEKILIKNAACYIGWTPYLTGRAISLGAKKAFTIEGGVDSKKFKPLHPKEKNSLKKKLKLNKLVIGVSGSLVWSAKQQYSYGLELIKILPYLKRTDISVLIIGDGPARSRLESLITDKNRSKVVFTGRISPNDMPKYLSLLDIGLVTQTLDKLGNFRLTTKLPEYLACSVCVAMSPIPGFFDYLWPNGIVLPNSHPASNEFTQELAKIVDDLNFGQINKFKRTGRQLAASRFDYRFLAKKLLTVLNSQINQ